MSTTDNKVKLQLRPSLTSPGPNILNRTDKNPSPSKLMINHGKPNYTINRSTSTPKNKSVTNDLPTSSCLTLPLKPTTSCSSQMERVVLKHVESSNIASPSAPGQKPQTPSSFVSPGISSKAAATSFGVKLKQCNKKNFQNDDGVTISNMHNCNIQNIEDEPEFVKRQKQIFEKLQQKEQNQLELTAPRYNLHQNGHSEKCISPRSDECNSKEIINISHVKPVNSNRLENVSSEQVVNNINNPNYQNQQNLSQNSICKLPQGAISSGKPVIPGKPPNLQIPSGRIMINQQNNLIKSKNNLINNANKISKPVTNITTVSKTVESQDYVDTSINNKNVLENLSGAIIEKETIVSLPEDLSTEMNFYPDNVKVIKTLSNGNGLSNFEDEDDDGLQEFIAIEHSAKLAEGIVQLKFDIKTDEQDVSVSNSDVSMK